MKQLILLIVVFFLVSCTSSMPFFPDPCANLEIESQELYDYLYLYDNIINYYLQTGPFEEDAFRTPFYADYYRQVFEPDVIMCTFSITTERDHLKQEHQGALYFSRGYLYITHFNNMESTLSFDPYQYVTRTDGVYSWKREAAKGTIFQRSPGDTLTFLAYYLDPGAVMRNLFWASRENPQLFSESRKGPITTLDFLDNNSLYQSFGYIENPLWLAEFQYLQGETQVRFKISPPKKTDCIPRSVTEIPDNIEWEYSEQSITSRQHYQ